MSLFDTYIDVYCVSETNSVILCNDVDKITGYVRFCMERGYETLQFRIDKLKKECKEWDELKNEEIERIEWSINSYELEERTKLVSSDVEIQKAISECYCKLTMMSDWDFEIEQAHFNVGTQKFENEMRERIEVAKNYFADFDTDLTISAENKAIILGAIEAVMLSIDQDIAYYKKTMGDKYSDYAKIVDDISVELDKLKNYYRELIS